MIIFHNMRDVPVVASEPTVRPVAWRIVRSSAGSSHLVAVVQSGSLRMTSALQTANEASRTVVTASGRVYELDTGPADDPQTVGLLMARARLELRDGCEDVSDEVWNRMLKSIQ
jgi:hypothetical protein